MNNESNIFAFLNYTIRCTEVHASSKCLCTSIKSYPMLCEGIWSRRNETGQIRSKNKLFHFIAGFTITRLNSNRKNPDFNEATNWK